MINCSNQGIGCYLEFIPRTDENCAGLKYDMSVTPQITPNQLLTSTRTYCWVVKFNEDGMITRVRAYIDTELLTRAMAQNT